MIILLNLYSEVKICGKKTAQGHRQLHPKSETWQLSTQL